MDFFRVLSFFILFQYTIYNPVFFGIRITHSLQINPIKKFKILSANLVGLTPPSNQYASVAFSPIAYQLSIQTLGPSTGYLIEENTPPTYSIVSNQTEPLVNFNLTLASIVAVSLAFTLSANGNDPNNVNRQFIFFVLQLFISM